VGGPSIWSWHWWVWGQLFRLLEKVT